MSLIILALIVVLFVTEVIPSATVALLGCVLYVLTGVCSFPRDRKSTRLNSSH